jgi:hypothetical protein
MPTIHKEAIAIMTPRCCFVPDEPPPLHGPQADHNPIARAMLCLSRDMGGGVPFAWDMHVYGNCKQKVGARPMKLDPSLDRGVVVH